MKTIIRNFLSVLRRFKMATALNVAGRAVGLDSFPIDIGQYLESATHDGSF